MKIIVDLFGGDKAPLEILKGCEMAVNELATQIIGVGKEVLIKTLAKDENISLNNITIINTEDVISFNDAPTDIMRKHSKCSMAEGLKLLANGIGDAFISAGSTGALVVGSSLIIKRLPGVKRPAIASILPADEGCFMLLDSGANYDCKPDILQQFAVMGSSIMGNMFNIARPRIGILNIGSEEIKGTELQKQTYELLKTEKNINFVGNIEPKAAYKKKCDVLLTDGFTGNIFLKCTEAVSFTLFKRVKDVMCKNIFNKMAALKLKKDFKILRLSLDSSEYGGAPLIGIIKPVIKAHGNSNAKAIKNAIAQGIKLAN